MTLAELRNRVLFQFNADADDMPDYEPHLTDYVNDGYDKLLYALTKHRVGESIFPVLTADEDVPKLLTWLHMPIADYATWLVYRNGNPQKQSRGQAYLQNFNEALSECYDLAGKVSVDTETGEITISSTKPKQFYNVYP